MSFTKDLYQFVTLTKSSKQPKLVSKIINDALQHPGTFVFSELLNEPNVQQLKGTEYQKEFETLCLFSFGTFTDYKNDKNKYIDLNDKQLYKLKQLSIVSYSATSRVLGYDLLLSKLDLKNLRELEDLLIDCFYTGLCKGKLDQRSKFVEIYECMGRDVPIENLDSLINSLKNWLSQSKQVVSSLEKNSSEAVSLFEAHKKQKEEYDQKVEQIKKDLKNSMELSESGGMMSLMGGLMGDPQGKKKKH